MSEATIHTQDVEGAAGVPSTSWLSTHHSSLVTHHSFEICHAITTAANSSFPVAFRLLSPARRRAMDALYAYMRVTDDIADEPAPPEETRRALAAWRAGLTAALAGAFTHPIHPALVEAVRRYAIPSRFLFDAIDGMETDAGPVRMATFADLYRSISTGGARGRSANGTGTRAAGTTHACPYRRAVYVWDARTGSRCRAGPYALVPGRPSTAPPPPDGPGRREPRGRAGPAPRGTPVARRTRARGSPRGSSVRCPGAR